MDDPAAKIKQLTEQLQAQQAKIARKKEEVEGVNKASTGLEQDVLDLHKQIGILGQAREIKKEQIAQDKLNLQKKIENAKRIVNADKAALVHQKAELEAKIQTLQADTAKLQEEKNTLLKSKQGVRRGLLYRFLEAKLLS